MALKREELEALRERASGTSTQDIPSGREEVFRALQKKAGGSRQKDTLAQNVGEGLERGGKQFAEGVGDILEFSNILAEPMSETVGDVRLKITGSSPIQMPLLPFMKLPQAELQFRSPKQARREGSEIVDTGVGDPANPLEMGARMGGQSFVLAGPVNKLLASIPAATGTGLFARGLRKVQQGFQTAMQRPVSTAALETEAGFLAGTAQGVIAERYPDSTIGQISAGLLAGMLPGVIPTRVAVRAGQRLRRRLREPWQPAGAARRAAERGQAAIEAGTGRVPTAVEARRAEIEKELRAPTTLDPRTGQPVLSVAARTGSPEFMSLEQDVLDQANKLTEEGREKLARANEVLQESLFGVAEDAPVSPTGVDPKFEGSPEVSINEMREYLGFLMDTRLRQAAASADDRVRALGRNATKKRAGQILQDEVDKAIDDIRQQENELWSARAIPRDTPVPTGMTREVLQDHIEELGKAGADKIPQKARKFFQRKIGGKNNPNYYGETTEFREMNSLRQEFRQQARNLRQGDSPDYQKADIFDSLADAIAEDLGRARVRGGSAEAITAALSFSRMAKGLTRESTAFDITKQRRGRRAIPTEDVAEKTIGIPGSKGRQALDEIKETLRLGREGAEPEGLRGQANPAATEQAAEEYIRARFAEEAIKPDGVDLEAARRILADHSELIDLLPDLKTEIQETLAAGRALQGVESTIFGETGQPRFVSKNAAKAALLAQQDPKQAFAALAEEVPREAVDRTKSLIDMVSKDPTGDALRGLRAGFIDWIYSVGKTGGRDVRGRTALSGLQMQEMLDRPSVQRMARTLFNREQRQRLRRVVNDLTRLEKRAAARGKGGDLLPDAPGILLERAARIFGAGVARKGAEYAGSQATVQIPGQGAELFHDIAVQLKRDPARRLISDAILSDDPDKFKNILLAKPEPKGDLSPKTRRAIVGWAASVLLEGGGAFEEDQEEPTTPAP